MKRFAVFCLESSRHVYRWLAVLATMTPFVLRAYLVGPPEGLDKMTTNADLICKARVISSVVISNASFRPLPGFKACETRLEIISVLKGTPPARSILFQHYASEPQGMWRYSPQHYELAAGQCYLIFAVKADHGEFQQIRMAHTGKEDEGVMRTLDDRPLEKRAHFVRTVKEAHWFEFNLLLNDTAPTNQIYAVQQLDAMSRKGGQDWGHTDDFQRADVLKALLPIVSNANDEVAIAALKCFPTGPENSGLTAPFTNTLVEIASQGSTIPRRVAAIAAFSGASFPSVRNALPQWLGDASEDVRLQAVLLLPNFPGEFSEHTLRERASDPSPKVRAGVADAIGNGKIEALLPTLQKLLSDPVGLTNPVPPLTTAELQGGGRVWGSNNSDVHTAVGYALLKFDVRQVSDILKANLNDEGFRPNYLCKLAEGGAGPWLTNLVEVLESHRFQVEKEVDASGIPPKDKTNYLRARMALTGTYFNCWNIIEQYLETRPAADFANGKLDRCLDALENAGTTGSREPTALYELYRAKGLTRRAATFRKTHGNREAGYDIELFYNRVDAKYPKPDASTDR
jgi:hypothetical protein